MAPPTPISPLLRFSMLRDKRAGWDKLAFARGAGGAAAVVLPLAIAGPTGHVQWGAYMALGALGRLAAALRNLRSPPTIPALRPAEEGLRAASEDGEMKGPLAARVALTRL